MNFFTTKVANASTFCNREQETEVLLSNISKNQHTVVVGPRRYGKTSLVEHALKKKKSLYARIDLFCVVYEEDICRKVARGISELLTEITSFSQKTIRLLEQCFKSAFLGFRSGRFEIKVEFGKTQTNPVSQLEELLIGLERLARQRKKEMVLFFDEFQDVLKVDQTNQIQAALRSVAQHSKLVTYIFSGSSRIMLNKIFDDNKQPLYMLCSKMILNRIEPGHFVKHINFAANKQWKSHLSDAVIDTILKLTECHPYYVNMLCDKLWLGQNKPNCEKVVNSWQEILFENRGKIIADLVPLNANRTKVLINVAMLGAVNEPNSKLFLDLVKLPLASTQNAVQYLLNHDYIYESHNGLKLIDPLMRLFLLERFKEIEQV